MKPLLLACPWLVFCLAILTQQGPTPEMQNLEFGFEHKPSAAKDLFGSDAILDMSLKGSVHDLLNDRSDQAKYHNIILSYRDSDNQEIAIPIEAKTRGHFRRQSENCVYPPLLLHFTKSGLLDSTLFSHNRKLKLVMPCQGDQYVIREWLVYRLFNLVTPESFRARLVRVKLEDTNKKKGYPLFYGMLLEEEQELANRTGNVIITRKLRPEQLQSEAFLQMAVFEFLIGNTDWSVQYLQNVKLLGPDSNATPTPVPYDFDMSGLVNTPYAKPAEELLMSSVSERRYRGYCIMDMKRFDTVLALYNHLKDPIYATINQCQVLDDKFKKSTIKFIDEFYETINNPVALKKAFQYPCDKSGTGNVVIKGLRDE
jgi:hypothetical protein